ncbi:CHAT domain-containing protein [Streptomyces sp. NPDC008121]|uniref:CHAT domain-containing protein n=1 Tax=Streptomyces sp. NPDC008121 TaxID=3364809 RepID=UPI0036E78013
MGEAESGGLRGLQAWVTAATERAAKLLPREGQQPPPREEYDDCVAELRQLETALYHDDSLRTKISVRLGVALALRYLAAGGAPEDREEARRILKATREDGAGADEADRRWAAMFLAQLALPVAEMGGSFGEAPRISDAFAMHDRLGTEQVVAAAQEIRAMLADVQGLASSLPPEARQQLENAAAVFTSLDRMDEAGGIARVLASLPPDSPYREELTALADLIPDVDTTPRATTPAPRAAADDGRAGAEGDTTTTADAGRPGAESGTPTPEDEGTTRAVGAMMPALLTAFEAYRRGDPEVLDQTLRRLRGAYDSLPPDHELRPVLASALGAVMSVGRGVGGALVDEETARRLSSDVPDLGESLVATGDPEGLMLPLRCLSLLTRQNEAAEAGDLAAVDAVVEELARMEAATPPDHMFRSLVLIVLGTAHQTRGGLTQDVAEQLRGLTRHEEALASGENTPASMRAMFPTLAADVRSMRAALTSDPEPLQGDLAAPPDAPTGDHWIAALAFVTRYRLTQDVADLEGAIAELEHVRSAVRRGERHYFAADALWQLAEVYQTRWARRNLEDQAAATGTAMEGLHALAADVVLQLGSEHGLTTARSGADRGVQAALWSARNAKVEETVAALELGRALVLQAASTAAAVPELLEARGRHDTAAAWRSWSAGRRTANGAGAADGTTDGTPADVLPGELPSSLRRQALEALGYREQGQGLFTTPTVAELQAGLADADADALVYLLAGTGEHPGMAVLIGPDIGTGVLQLPLMSGPGSRPLDDYLEAASVRSRRLREAADTSLAADDPEAERAALREAEEGWETALSALCDWAFEAALGHVLQGVAQRLAANEDRRRGRPGGPRIVLVPCGRLGVVPWHAARLPAAAPQDYACQVMVISYAASGGQFLRTVKRNRRAPGAAPALVADPRMDLTHAEREATALHVSFYPEARLLGEFYDPPAEPVAAGTPDDLLGLLGGPRPVSLLHVASHGSAGVRPTASALHLAFPGDSETLPPERGGRGAEPDLGMLTVTRLLDHTAGERPATDGPLVVLSACETDLSTRDHDEALTLTTAFVASGARDVVGSRWTTQDGASAVMMAVFHHFVAVEGFSPADALRGAQMWMLDPDRTAPPSFGEELRREMERPGLDRLPVWAAFIHQGHPGMGRRTLRR